jgi:hypothetical protein
MIECMKCFDKFKNFRALSAHLRKHDMTLKQYRKEYGLQSKRKLYVLLRRHNDTGEIQGLVDASICSLDYRPNLAIVWRYPPTHYYPGLKGSRSKRDPDSKWDYFISRVNSKTCPIEVDMRRNPGNIRFGKGNRIFNVKEKGD